MVIGAFCNGGEPRWIPLHESLPALGGPNGGLFTTDDDDDLSFLIFPERFETDTGVGSRRISTSLECGCSAL